MLYKGKPKFFGSIGPKIVKNEKAIILRCLYHFSFANNFKMNTLKNWKHHFLTFLSGAILVKNCRSQHTHAVLTTTVFAADR